MNESTMQDEVQSLRAELDALHTKYDLLRNIHSRQMLRSQSQQQLTPPKAPSTPQSRRYRGESYDLFDEKRCQKKAQLQAPAVDDESTERSSLYVKIFVLSVPYVVLTLHAELDNLII